MDAAVAGPERPEAGFTLIEMLVVVAVLSVLAVGASLAAGRTGAVGQDDATRLRAAFDAQRQLAVEGRQWRGLTPGLRALTLQIRDENGWQDLGTPRPWRGRVRFAGESIGAVPGADLPAILFSPDGRTTAFSIILTGGGRAGPLRCASDGRTGLTCDDT